MKRHANIMIIVMLKHLKKTIKYRSTLKVKNLSKHHLFISYAVTEPLFKKIYVCENNSENLLTTKVSKHTLHVFIQHLQCVFDNRKNENDH